MDITVTRQYRNRDFFKDVNNSALYGSTTQLNTHNSLTGLQGGTTDQYYHLNASEYIELHQWLDNVILDSAGNVELDGGLTTGSDIYSGMDVIAFASGSPTGSFWDAIPHRWSIEYTNSALQLLNDADAPGINKMYGTNPSGTKGWYDVPSSVSYPSGTGIVTVAAGAAWGTTISPSAGWLYYSGSAYSWSAPTLNDIGNPTGDKLFTMTTRQLKFLWTNPAPSGGSLELEATGNYSGDILHIHQNTGAPGAGTDLLHLECTSTNVIPLRINGSSTGQIMTLLNPAGSFSYNIYTGAIGADRNLTLPAITASDIFVTEAFTQTLTNKTLTSPKINENVALTTTATKLNYLTSATGTTGTTSTNIVFSTSPALTTPTVVTSIVGDATFAAFNTVSTNLSIGGAATTLTIGGTPTTAITHSYSANATATGTTKTINFGTAGATGSTTNINIGSTAGGTLTINLPTLTFGSTTTTINGTVTYGDYDHTFKDNRLKINNPSDTYAYTITAGAIGGNYALNLPVITSADTLAVLGLAQTFSDTISFSSASAGIKVDHIAEYTTAGGGHGIVHDSKIVTTPGTFRSDVADGTNVVAFEFASGSAYSGSGALLLKVKNYTDEKMSVSKSGTITAAEDVIAYATGSAGTPLSADTFKTWSIVSDTHTWDDTTVVASGSDTMDFVAGTGISLTMAGDTKAIKITNTGATSAHASTHLSTGSDVISLFSTSGTTSGLTPGSSGVGATYFLNATGGWTVPTGSGSSKWTDVGSGNIYRNSKVMIGSTSDPTYQFEVKGGGRVYIAPDTGTSYAYTTLVNTGGTAQIGIDSSGGGVTGTAYAFTIWHGGNYPIIFGTNATVRATITNDGKLGLNCTPLDVLTVLATGTQKYSLGADGLTRNDGDNDSQPLRINYTGYNLGTTRYRDLEIGDGKTNRILYVDGSASSVGIGNSAPGTKLEVTGTIRANAGSNVGEVQLGGADTKLRSAASAMFYVDTWDGADYFNILHSDGANHKLFLCETEGGVNIGTSTGNSSGLTVKTTLYLTNDTQTSYVQQSSTEMYIHNGYGNAYFECDGTLYFRTYRSSAYQTDMVVEHDSGYIGMGTDNPAAKLHIYGTGDVGLYIDSSINSPNLMWCKAGAYKFFFGIDRDSPVYGLAANDFFLYNASTSSVNLSVKYSTGHVAIGSHSPTSPLHISSTNTTPFLVTYTGVSSWAVQNSSSGTGWWMGVQHNRALGIGRNGANDISIDTSGNITMNTYFQAHNSSWAISGGTNAGQSGVFVWHDSATKNVTPLGIGIAINRSGTAAYFTNASGNAAIFDAGYVFIGGTSGSQKLTVHGEIGIRNGNNLVHYVSGDANYFNWAPSSSTLYDLKYNNVSKFYFSSAGNFYAVGESTTQYSSDKYFKKNISPFNALDIVDKMNPVSFKWNDLSKRYRNNNDDHIHYGVIAQELEETMPQYVGTIYDKYKSIVNQNDFIYIALKAIKELKERLEVLECK